MKNIIMRTLVWMLVFSLALPAGVFAQGYNAPPAFRQEELEQMLAPIALYPDTLLVQMLMAATYPLEVVEAARWANQNPNLTGDQLTAALQYKYWDPSVKSMVTFPNALAMMDGNIEWTQKLGDAFLAQKDQVMDTIQSLRGRAQAQGNLRTTAEQVVTSRDQAIVIEPANPEIVYVPVYNPSEVYGYWAYPDYPPYYYYPPGYVIGNIVGGLLSFGVGLFLGAAWWGHACGDFDWHHHRVYYSERRHVINHDYAINRHGFTNWSSTRTGERSEWQHNPAHRRNVIYRDVTTRQRYGQVLGLPKIERRNDFWERGRNDYKERILTDPRATRGRIGDKSGMEQPRKVIQGSDGAAVERKAALMTTNQASNERRALRSFQERERSTMEKRRDISVVDRPEVQMKREKIRYPAQPQPEKQVTAPVYGGTIGKTYRNSEKAFPTFRGPERMSPSYREAEMAKPSHRVEKIERASQDGRGFTGRTKGDFSEKTRRFAGRDQAGLRY